MRQLATAWFGIVLGIAPAHARTICTIVADASDGRVVMQQGDCTTRVTPGSTFKIPLAVIGFDSGFLKDAHTPVLPYKTGYPDWGGDAWKQPTDPTRWLKYSVVWYSEVVAHELGQARIEDALRGFGFGNADMTGDPGRDNGLDRAWIMSSLKVSPAEQVTFLRRLVQDELPAARFAIEQAKAIVETSPAGTGVAHGKTGAAYPRNPDGSFDDRHGYGWYVGWITQGPATYVFARLDQDESADPVTPGVRARAAFLQQWPTLAGRLPTAP